MLTSDLIFRIGTIGGEFSLALNMERLSIRITQELCPEYLEGWHPHDKLWKPTVWMDGRLYEYDVLKPYVDDDSFERLITGPAAHNPDTYTDTEEPQPRKDKVVRGTWDHVSPQGRTTSDGLDYSKAKKEVVRDFCQKLRESDDDEDDTEPESPLGNYESGGWNIFEDWYVITAINMLTEERHVWTRYHISEKGHCYDRFVLECSTDGSTRTMDRARFLQYSWVVKDFGLENMTNIIQKGENP